MNLGGLQKTSLIDYPRKISCILFLSGCNFDCPYCHNPQLIKGIPTAPDQLNETSLFDFLEKRRGLLEGVVITGGEPTLQSDLTALCERIKQLGYPVKLDTNGSRPHVIGRLIDQGLVDYIAMDIKTVPAGYSPYLWKHADPDRILLSISTILNSGLPHEFRTTCVRPFVDAEIIAGIARLIEGAQLYALQKFHDGTVLHPEFFQDKNVFFEDLDLQHFKSIAAPRVQKCVIR